MANAPHDGDHVNLIPISLYRQVVGNERIVFEAYCHQRPARTKVKGKGHTVVVLGFEGQGHRNLLEIEEANVLVIAGGHQE